jgi:hypothetical protein
LPVAPRRLLRRAGEAKRPLRESGAAYASADAPIDHVLLLLDRPQRGLGKRPWTGGS